MNILRCFLISTSLIGISFTEKSQPPVLQAKEINMDIIAADGTKLKSTFYSAGKQGPGLLLLHQCNMDRSSWKTVSTYLANQGIHVLTFDYRGYGDTKVPGDNSFLEKDIDAALKTLMAQSGVDQTHIAAGGASCSVENAIQLSRRSNLIKALLLFSGLCSPNSLSHLQSHTKIPILGAASAEEDFAVKAIMEMVSISKNPISTMKTLQHAGHGAPMFEADKTLLPFVAEWISRALR